MDIQIHQDGALSSGVEQSYDGLLMALGSPQLEQRFVAAVQQLAEVDRLHCFRLAPDEVGPTLFCSWTSSPYPADLLDRYRLLYHHHDPVREVLTRIPLASCASITFEAEEIRHADYRKTFFERFSIRHRLSVVKRVSNGWLALNLSRRSRCFSAEEVAGVSMLSRLALPLFAQQDRLKTKTTGGNFSVAEMERRLEAIGKGLTTREREVCARTIAGISAEGAGLDLGISTASVLTYRQRAYRRANVSNAMQLAALVLH